MSIKIGSSFTITRGPQVECTVHSYAGGSIGIRGRIQAGEYLKETERGLYLLREGSLQEIEVMTEKGELLRGSYKINELNWRKQKKKNGDYELVFNIGLQKESS